MFDLFNDMQQQNETASSSVSQESNSYSSNDSIGDFSSRKTIVLSVGGSVFFGEKPKTTAIAKFCETINGLVREGYSFVLVIGGGKTARTYIAGAKALGATNFELDEVGIAITKTNALLFTYNIEKAWKDVLSDVKWARKVLSIGRIPIFGGIFPGQTTDGVAASIAEFLKCDFCNLSNVDGVYASDPAKVAGTKMFDEINHAKMVSLIKAIASKPGAHTFIDPHAANILARSKVRSFFINGSNLENFKSCVRGQEFRGTIVQTLETVSDSSAPNEREVREVAEELDENPIEDEEKEIDPHEIDF